jgi:hypothetical protein
MADLGWIGRKGVERMKLFAKSKEVLEFLHDIRKYITSQKELCIIEQTSQIITDIINRMMDENHNSLD